MAEETQTSQTEKHEPTEEEEELIKKWKGRFDRAEEFWKPYRAKRLRMYMHYRAYREKSNYAYETNLMPPIAFEIVETVKPRLTGAKTNVRILPRFKKDAKSKSLEAWDDKIKYDLDTIGFNKLKEQWITSALTFGDGLIGLIWNPGQDKKEDGDPYAWLQDLWLFYPDPEAIDLQKDSKWEIVRLFKTKKELEKNQENRNEKGELVSGIYKNLKGLEEKEITDDPRKERYEINTKKMGQIAGGGSEEGEKTEEKIKEKKVELWQIWDHEEDKLIVIANREAIIRDEESPYKNINKGRIFIHLQDHIVLWELWSIGHIEPVETTIIELADSRNQAMDDIVFTLDPIRKVRKDAHLTAKDIVHEPGATWQLKNVDDVIIERPPGIDRQWLEKDALLRKEIQMALALSEYAMGLPKSPQEAKAKIDLLLMQSNIRFSGLVDRFSEAMTQLVNNLIELNGEFLTKDKTYRLIGEEVEFKDFKDSDKQVKVDAIVEIEPQVERTPRQRKEDALLLYKLFVAEDKPDPQDERAVEQWKVRKRTLQKMILEECGREQYEDLILGIEEKAEKKKIVPKEEVPVPPSPPQAIPPSPPIQPTLPMAPPSPLAGVRGLMQRIPLIGRIVG